MSAKYVELFSDWNDVAREFTDLGYISGNDDPKMVGVLAMIPEPDEVYVAAYEYEDYSGDAFVAFRRGDKFYIQTGGHCSCFGLEGQWAPEEYDRETFIAYLQKIEAGGYGLERRHAGDVLERVLP